ncbi:exonuclease SbcCD subunit D [Massilibacterium senegalense]|uniref:exonuclease SbcCD subunit D n=1 Tax=Massilibacterium senegalense TaxID=1632858 RepID=UPI000783472E|nr:exonuclease SbcCD subunit D [Massilibacterium senegalense]
MKFFHTADWHLGKLVQGVYMTDDQRYILEQMVEAIDKEQPDAVLIAGDLYDRSVPPIEAVELFNKVLVQIVMDKKIPVLAISGNHDSSNRVHFGSDIMKENQLFITGELSLPIEPVMLEDEFGSVHFYLIPFSEPQKIRHIFEDDSIKTHDDAMKAIVHHINEQRKPGVRSVIVSHAFVTPYGEEEKNTSTSERPLAIGGSEYVQAKHFESFHYTALGHLHRAHFVKQESIRYSGSPLKYSISEEKHEKGYYIVEMDAEGSVKVEKHPLIAKRDIRTVTGTLDDILTHEKNEDYVFVKLLDENPVLYPMEKIRTVYPNAMHVERIISFAKNDEITASEMKRSDMDTLSLFRSFYKEMKGIELEKEKEQLFKEVVDEILREEQ